MALPPIVTDSPVMDSVIVVVGSVVKVAVTVDGALIVKPLGFVVPLSAPPNPEKEYPALGVAVIWTVTPAFCHPLTGEMLPPVPADVVR